MKRILVTNDDGVRSEGLTALAAALEPLGEVIVVAPAKEARPAPEAPPVPEAPQAPEAPPGA
jgi:5'-nucleotidase